MRATIYSKVYLEQEEETWCARPSAGVLEYLHEQEEPSARWIVVLGAGLRIALGDPISTGNRWEKRLYLPTWFLDHAGMKGEGETMTLRFERCEELPKATRLGFEILGDVPEGVDLREVLEEPLSSLGVLQVGQILPVPVLEGVHLLVHTCENDRVKEGAFFLDGSEVALEIEDGSGGDGFTTEPAPGIYRGTPEAFEEGSMFDMPHSLGTSPFEGIGHRLGN